MELRYLRPTSIIAGIRSPIFIATLKGTLSYVIFFVLFFLDSYRGLFPYPAVGGSAILFVIAAFPGKSIGVSLLSVLLGLAGIAVGSFNFFLLANLAAIPAIQAIVFAVIVYFLGRVKALGPHSFIFALLCILMSWNGIYTPFLLPQRKFSSDYLSSYLEAYCWGAAIGLSINMLVFPHSAEQELRVALVTSLDHTKTFCHLIEKTYRFTITEDEKQMRDRLAQSIRGDADQLEKKIGETILEVTYSRWTLSEYARMIKILKSMNYSLATAHSSLLLVDEISSGTFRENFLLSCGKDMALVRKQVHIALTEIQKGLALESMLASLDQNQCEWLRQDAEQSRLAKYPLEREYSDKSSPGAVALPLFKVSGSHEYPDLTASQMRKTSGHFPLTFSATEPLLRNTNEGPSSTPVASREPPPSTPSPTRLEPSSTSEPISELIRLSWQAFLGMQYRRINEILLFGNCGRTKDELMTVNSPQTFGISLKSPCLTPGAAVPQLSETRFNPGAVTSQASLLIDEEASSESSSQEGERTDDSTLGSLEEMMNIELRRSLIRASSYSFSMGNFIDELIELRGLAQDWNNLNSSRPMQLHVHPLETFQTTSRSKAHSDIDDQDDRQPYLSISSDREAFDLLAGGQHPPRRINLISKLIAIERFFRGHNSIHALKMTFALTTIGILFWADKTRRFALDYGLSGAILTSVVAVAPTLGQTWLSFFAQLTGQGFGSIYGMIILKMFGDLGGYRYNPYGLVAGMAIYAVPMCYILYSKPHLFVMPFLAMNSAGSLVYIEYINQYRSFDPPPLKMAKNLTSLMIAIMTVTAVQMLVLRNPARHTLRSAVAKIMQANSTHTIMLYAYIKAVLNPDPSLRPSANALAQVHDYLIKTEDRLQRDILALIPLLRFAAAEPSLGNVDSVEVEYLRISTANQVILDRNREARIAMGNAPFSNLMLAEFAEVLKPHRQRASALINNMFYACTASLKAKLPLPSVDPLENSIRELSFQMFDDTVALSGTLAQAPGGISILQDDELPRYWMYLLSVNGVLVQLENIRRSCKSILGRVGAEETV